MPYNGLPPSDNTHNKEFNGRLRDAEKDIVELKTEMRFIREQIKEFDEKLDGLIKTVESNNEKQYGIMLQLLAGALGGVIMWLAQILGKKTGLM